jgi:pimeloyl-ACP methyl ester carboxylesterase
MSTTQVESLSKSSAEYARQSEKLSLASADDASQSTSGSTAVEAKFITPLDPVIQTADGCRLPAVPVEEAHMINVLKQQAENSPDSGTVLQGLLANKNNRGGELEVDEPPEARAHSHERASKMGAAAVPPSRTHPLFPPLPLYGPPSLLRDLQCQTFRITSFFLSTAFLAVIVLGSVFTSIPLMLKHLGLRLTLRNPDKRRPFYEEEIRRKSARRQASQTWRRQRRRRGSQHAHGKEEDGSAREYEPLEGGPDPLVCDIAYYARRVGLNVEEFNVQTEDGFIITLWHVYNPSEYTPVPQEKRNYQSPDVFINSDMPGCVRKQYSDGTRRYPVLLMHGLLQSAGAYCTNDDDSLAFFLCKSGYDVWLGNNRCGFDPRHTLLRYYDPRMWAWNIRQMGVMDLPALISRVLLETGFEKLGLVCHSQGTTETFVALAKEQRPDLGDKISVFCALAPAVYAGPLIGKMYFKFMRVISPSMFRIFFGIHAFIPLMMTMHRLLPGILYGAMGYRVFSFLFNWTDDRWERDLRDRMFQFAPVYVSSESMRWWLGRECFAKQKCILATREEGKIEDMEDEEDEQEEAHKENCSQGRTAWYDERAPPFALWIAGSDDLVDGRRLLRRFKRGREPHVRLVKAKVIEEYEHLDVIWAMDSIEKVGKEVRDVIWETAPREAYQTCRTPSGLQQKTAAQGRW